uniref:CSON002459 protein n=1 Tax=Culicoides sonorensis TaxID=179676 RepID=A0A336K5W7_CULSO
MKFIIYFFLLIFAKVNCDCLLKGQCKSDKEFVQIVNVPPSKGELDATGLEILRKRCPELYDGENSSVCCESPQLIQMDKSFKAADMYFGKCETCTRNMLKSICALICSPQQSRFVSVAKIYENDTTCASSVNFSIDHDYMQTTFDSCKSITSPMTMTRAFDVACGDETSFSCTPVKWYKFLGDVEKFKVNYVTNESNPERRFTYPVKECNENYDNSTACSCNDCPIACSIKHQPRDYDEDDSKLMHQMTFVLLSITCLILIILYILSNSSIGTCKWIQGGLSIDIYLKKVFTRWGEMIANRPKIVLAIFFIVVMNLSWGIKFIKVTTDPVQLWAAPDSRARQEKDYYDAKFGPFYRTEQVFLIPKYQGKLNHPNYTEHGPVYNFTFLNEVLKLQDSILNLGRDENEGLEKICYAPVMEENQPVKLENCVVQSIFGYLGDMSDFNEDYNFVEDRIGNCMRNPYRHDCLSKWGGPALPELVIGGYPKTDKDSPPQYHLAKALSITIVVKNYKNSTLLESAMKWEKRFIDFLSNYHNDHFDFAFKAERSIEDGINEMSDAEILTVIVSYSLMFLYIVFSLGRIRKLKSFFMESKITLAFGGILIVMASVTCSLGIFGFAGVSTTMLTIEVIPFLVLAVGVDNIFILVQTFNRLERHEDVSKGLGIALGEVGPSLLLTAASECFCFSIGALSNMPAVKTFAYFSTVAIFLDFVFQTTAFVALIALDEKRCRNMRYDLVCCFKSKETPKSFKNNRGVTESIFDLFYTPLIMSKSVQIMVLIAMILWTSFSLYVLPHIEPGLEQDLTMPKDSSLAKYFRFMEKYLNMGPPVYFVVKPGLNYSIEEDQNLICGGIACHPNSLISQIGGASYNSDKTKIAKISNSWLDDYFDWIKNGDCFSKKKNRIKLKGKRPVNKVFDDNLSKYLANLPGESCPKGGKAVYADAIHFNENKIQNTYFMTYHTPLKSSRDYYTALEQARILSDNINEVFRAHKRDAEVFPYSIFYVFYEQYLTIWKDAAISLGLALFAVFVITFLVTGFDLISSLIVLFMVGMILINMGGFMWMFSISLNAISLVNLVVCVGIGVEFVSHIVWAYAQSSGTRIERASQTLTTTGSSVLSGIALTKFCGIVVLAFARSQIFRVFYFQMYMGIVLIGAVHGLIFLPILLCYLGKQSKTDSVN